MGFIKKHRLRLGILSFLFMGLPQAIAAIWFLAEKIQGANIVMPEISIVWFSWITVPVGIIMLAIIIFQGRRDKRTVSPELERRKKELDLVIEAIAEAKEITRKGQEVKVYISSSTKLDTIFPEQIKDLLLKLQDDERIITLKSFPDWLLPHSRFTIDLHHSRMEAIRDPSRKHFIVDILGGFDEWCVNYRAKT